MIDDRTERNDGGDSGSSDSSGSGTFDSNDGGLNPASVTADSFTSQQPARAEPGTTRGVTPSAKTGTSSGTSSATKRAGGRPRSAGSGGGTATAKSGTASYAGNARKPQGQAQAKSGMAQAPITPDMPNAAEDKKPSQSAIRKDWIEEALAEGLKIGAGSIAHTRPNAVRHIWVMEEGEARGIAEKVVAALPAMPVKVTRFVNKNADLIAAVVALGGAVAGRLLAEKMVLQQLAGQQEKAAQGGNFRVYTRNEPNERREGGGAPGDNPRDASGNPENPLTDISVFRVYGGA